MRERVSVRSRVRNGIGYANHASHNHFGDVVHYHSSALRRAPKDVELTAVACLPTLFVAFTVVIASAYLAGLSLLPAAWLTAPAAAAGIGAAFLGAVEALMKRRGWCVMRYRDRSVTYGRETFGFREIWDMEYGMTKSVLVIYVVRGAPQKISAWMRREDAKYIHDVYHGEY